MAAPHTSPWEVSDGPHWHPYGHDMTSQSSIPSSTSTTLVEPPPSPNERPSIELKISRCGADILNAVVVDSVGRPLYSISSDESRTALLAERNRSMVATIDWDRFNPRMVFRGKKVKCKRWLPRAGPNTMTRMFKHGDSQLKWIQKSDRGILIPSNRRGLAVAKWHTESHGDGLRLQIFHEVLVEPGLLEAILLSIILLQSGHSLGDTPHPVTDSAPGFYSIGFAKLA